MTRRLARLTAAVTATLAVAWLLTSPPPASVGHAAGTSVASARLSTFRPAGLPPVCASNTVVAIADAYVSEQQVTTNYGTATTMNVAARTNRNARALVQFNLPSVPAGCTLTSATLRVNNTLPATGRTISASRAGSAWTETGVTWTSAPTTTGTAVDIPAATGWMQWSVTAHVQAMYAGTNNGFVLRDASEGGTTTFTQVFATRESTNKPELVLQWG